MLEVLLAADGAVVGPRSCSTRVWDENADPFTNTVRMTVMTLRRKLGDPPVIETVHAAPGTGVRSTVRAPPDGALRAAVRQPRRACCWRQLLAALAPPPPHASRRRCAERRARAARAAVPARLRRHAILAPARRLGRRRPGARADRAHHAPRPPRLQERLDERHRADGPGRRAARAGRHASTRCSTASTVVRRPAPVRGQRQPRAAQPADRDPHRGRGRARRPAAPTRAELRAMGEVVVEAADRTEALLDGADGPRPQPAGAAEPRAARPAPGRPRRRASGSRRGARPRGRRARSPERAAPALGDRRLLERLVANLLENAVRHNQPGRLGGRSTTAARRRRVHTGREHRAAGRPERRRLAWPSPSSASAATPTPAAPAWASRSCARSPRPTAARSGCEPRDGGGLEAEVPLPVARRRG